MKTFEFLCLTKILRCETQFLFLIINTTVLLKNCLIVLIATLTLAKYLAETITEIVKAKIKMKTIH